MIFVVVQAADVAKSPAVEWIVDDLRARADAFVFLSGGVLTGSPPADDGARGLVPAVEALGVARHADLFEIFPLERGPDALERVLLARLRPGG